MANKSGSANVRRYIRTGRATIVGPPREILFPPETFVLQAVVTRVGSSDEGSFVVALEPAWLKIRSLLASDPQALMHLSPEQFEELIAASYDKAGFDEVILTPRSGDFGRDVIAIRRGWGSVRVIDQAKRFKHGHVVTANDVRALLGVLHADRNATKGVVTTTSTFAPKIKLDPTIAPYVPFRLELVNGDELSKRIATLAGE